MRELAFSTNQSKREFVVDRENSKIYHMPAESIEKLPQRMEEMLPEIKQHYKNQTEEYYERYRGRKPVTQTKKLTQDSAKPSKQLIARTTRRQDEVNLDKRFKKAMAQIEKEDK